MAGDRYPHKHGLVYRSARFGLVVGLSALAALEVKADFFDKVTPAGVIQDIGGKCLGLAQAPHRGAHPAAERIGLGHGNSCTVYLDHQGNVTGFKVTETAQQAGGTTPSSFAVRQLGSADSPSFAWGDTVNGQTAAGTEQPDGTFPPPVTYPAGRSRQAVAVPGITAPSSWDSLPFEQRPSNSAPGFAEVQLRLIDSAARQLLESAVTVPPQAAA